MKKYPVSVQLYSLRDASEQNFDAVLESIAAFGYQGVEPFNLFGKTPAEFRAKVDSIGLKVSSTHTPWGVAAEVSEIVEVAGIFGTRFVVGGYSQEELSTHEDALKLADEINARVDALAAQGVTFCLHNHWWEFLRINDKLIYDTIAEACPKLSFETDVYWAANFGAESPADVVSRLASRIPLMHVKDGPLVRDEPMLALGQGKVPVLDCIAAADPDALEWLVVELDECATDMTEAVGASYNYLRDQGVVAK